MNNTKIVKSIIESLKEEKYDPNRVFPDTKQGAIDALAYMANPALLDELDIKTCKVHPDPSAIGVWAIDSKKTNMRYVVYLAGHSNRISENDFESGDLPN